MIFIFDEVGTFSINEFEKMPLLNSAIVTFFFHTLNLHNLFKVMWCVPAIKQVNHCNFRYFSEFNLLMIFPTYDLFSKDIQMVSFY